jgi:two-component system cell cycle sensor histidine kinase/response regulator CckA
MKVHREVSDSTVPPAIFIKRLAAGILLINLCVIVLAGLLLRKSKLQYEERAAVTTQNLAQMLEKCIGGSIDKTDVVLLTAVDEIEKQFTGGAIDVRKLNVYLARQSARLPELDGLRMLNAKGEIAYGKGVTAGKLKSAADCGYFKRLRADPNAGLYISRPIVSRIIGKWVIMIARRVNRTNGDFAGVVYGVIPLEHFLRLFNSIDVGKHGAISLRDGELGVVSRYPEPQGVGSTVGRKEVSREFRELIRAGRSSGTFKARSPVDKIERTYTYRKIFNYSLYVSVGLATNEYLAEWRGEVTKMSVSAAIFFITTLLMSWLIYNDWKRKNAAVLALVRQEAKFRTIADYTYDWEFWLGPDGDFIHTSPSCRRITGYDADAFYAAPGLLSRIVHPEDRERFAKYLHDAQAGVSIENPVLRIFNSDGDVRWLEQVCQPIVDESGTFLGIRGSSRDITERKSAEEALRESEIRYRRLFQDAVLGLFQLTAEGRIITVNPACARMFGYSSPEELLSNVENAAEVYADPSRRAEIVRLILESTASLKIENQYRRKDGSVFTGNLVVWQVKDAEGRLMYFEGFIEDISDLKRAEQERINLEAQLNQAQKMEAIGQLAGGIAHDFNNIITAIFSYSEIILMRMEKDSPLRHHVEQVLKSAERAAELTAGLLAFSRKQVLHPKPLGLAEVVRGMKQMIRRLIPEDIDLRTTVVEEDLMVLADRGQIEQVLMNLVTNAKDAMPKGGALVIEVSPSVIDDRFIYAHGFGKPGSYACISVADTGCGIDTETQKKIFEPFFTTKEVGKGTGLGLAIIYGIVKQHDGYVTVDSAKETGTTFRVYLPLIVEKEEAHDIRREQTPAGGTETILLAEDDETVRELCRMILEEAGYTVIEAVDGSDALDKFMKHRSEADILATDVIMPKIDGKRLYEEIAKVRLDMKVLFMSGYSKDINIERGIPENDLNFLAKPVIPCELLKKLRKILDNG